MNERPDETSAPLPALNDALLCAEELDRLLADVAAHGERIEVRIRGRNGGRMTADDPSNGSSGTGWDERRIRGALAAVPPSSVQLRYLFDGGWWWDTLLPVGRRVRLVRIRHDP